MYTPEIELVCRCLAALLSPFLAVPASAADIETVPLREYIDLLRPSIYETLKRRGETDQPLFVDTFSVDVRIVHLRGEEGKLETLVLLDGDRPGLSVQRLTIPFSLGDKVLVTGQSDEAPATRIWSTEELLGQTLHDTIGQPVGAIDVILFTDAATVVTQTFEGNYISAPVREIRHARDGRLMAPIIAAGEGSPPATDE